jgi:hypothetical protein
VIVAGGSGVALPLGVGVALGRVVGDADGVGRGVGVAPPPPLGVLPPPLHANNAEQTPAKTSAIERRFTDEPPLRSFTTSRKCPAITAGVRTVTLRARE